jgi:hypothetical protein
MLRLRRNSRTMSDRHPGMIPRSLACVYRLIGTASRGGFEEYPRPLARGGLLA